MISYVTPDTGNRNADRILGKPKTADYRPTATGWPLWLVPNLGLFNLADVDVMRLDPQVSLCLAFRKAPIATAEFEYEASSEEVGRFGARHAYEAPVALVAAFAGLTAAALTLSISLLMGEGLPTIMPGRAFTTAIPVELLIVPLGLAVAWLEFGRFLVLRRPADAALSVTPGPTRITKEVEQ